MSNEAEYEALERLVTADKRYRKFVYVLTIAAFIFLGWSLFSLKNRIGNQVDEISKIATEKSEQVINEGRTRDRETTKYITCIFVIPIADRTPEAQQRCFNEADLPGGLSREDFSTFQLNKDTFSTSAGSVASQPDSQSVGSSNTSSSPHNTPANTPSQLDTLQSQSEVAQVEPFIQQAYDAIVKFIKEAF